MYVKLKKFQIATKVAGWRASGGEENTNYYDTVMGG